MLCYFHLPFIFALHSFHFFLNAGFLAITVGSGSNAHEIMTDAVQHLHQTLKSGSDPSKKSSVCYVYPS